MSSTRNRIVLAQAAAAIALTAKNRGAASSAVTAVSYQGSDRNYIDALVTAAGVTVNYQGSDDNYLTAFSDAVTALSVVE